MKEIKKLILAGDEVDEYYKMNDNFVEAVEKGVRKELSFKNTWRNFFMFLIVWIVTLIGLNKWL